MRKIVLILTLLLAVNLHAVHVVFRLDDPTVSADSVTMRVLHMFHEKQVPSVVAVSVLLGLAFFMLAMLHMSGPLKLLAMDVVVSVIGLVIYFVIVSINLR